MSLFKGVSLILSTAMKVQSEHSLNMVFLTAFASVKNCADYPFEHDTTDQSIRKPSTKPLQLRGDAVRLMWARFRSTRIGLNNGPVVAERL